MKRTITEDFDPSLFSDLTLAKALATAVSRLLPWADHQPGCNLDPWNWDVDDPERPLPGELGPECNCALEQFVTGCKLLIDEARVRKAAR